MKPSNPYRFSFVSLSLPWAKSKGVLNAESLSPNLIPPAVSQYHPSARCRRLRRRRLNLASGVEAVIPFTAQVSQEIGPKLDFPQEVEQGPVKVRLRWPMLQGVFTFPWYRGSLGAWGWLAALAFLHLLLVKTMLLWWPY